MAARIRAAVVGSTGYGGVDLLRLLRRHPHVEVTSVISSSSAGQDISGGYPHLADIYEGTLDPVDVDLIRQKADVVFAATPSGASSELVPAFLDAGLKVIDLSGDFRLKSGALYEKWYRKKPADEKYLVRAVYGLCEVFGDEVKGSDFVSNPGCYPTAALLGLIPAVKAGWVDPETIIIDAKSGVSGAGRSLSLTVHYSEINENFKAYRVNSHQHTPEIEMALEKATGATVPVTFTPHLVPMTRGILCTMYARLKEHRTEQDFIDLYREFYRGRPFVRIRGRGVWPATKEVWGSNYCDIGFSVDERTHRVTILSVIDNLVKGAAGQAVQNLNLMMGWDESAGLELVPVYP